jgi:hypothetical protein
MCVCDAVCRVGAWAAVGVITWRLGISACDVIETTGCWKIQSAVNATAVLISNEVKPSAFFEVPDPKFLHSARRGSFYLSKTNTQ